MPFVVNYICSEGDVRGGGGGWGELDLSASVEGSLSQGRVECLSRLGALLLS